MKTLWSLYWSGSSAGVQWIKRKWLAPHRQHHSNKPVQGNWIHCRGAQGAASQQRHQEHSWTQREVNTGLRLIFCKEGVPQGRVRLHRRKPTQHWLSRSHLIPNGIPRCQYSLLALLSLSLSTFFKAAALLFSPSWCFSSSTFEANTSCYCLDPDWLILANWFPFTYLSCITGLHWTAFFDYSASFLLFGFDTSSVQYHWKAEIIHDCSWIYSDLMLILYKINLAAKCLQK